MKIFIPSALSVTHTYEGKYLVYFQSLDTMGSVIFKRTFLLVGFTFSLKYDQFCFCECAEKKYSETILKTLKELNMKDPLLLQSGGVLLSKEYKTDILKCLSFHHQFSKFVNDSSFNDNPMNQPLLMWNKQTGLMLPPKSKGLVILDRENSETLIETLTLTLGKRFTF